MKFLCADLVWQLHLQATYKTVPDSRGMHNCSPMVPLPVVTLYCLTHIALVVQRLLSLLYSLLKQLGVAVVLPMAGAACQSPLGVSCLCREPSEADCLLPAVTRATCEPPWLTKPAGPDGRWDSEGKNPVRAIMLTRSTSACKVFTQTPSATDLRVISSSTARHLKACDELNWAVYASV